MCSILCNNLNGKRIDACITEITLMKPVHVKPTLLINSTPIKPNKKPPNQKPKEPKAHRASSLEL